MTLVELEEIIRWLEREAAAYVNEKYVTTTDKFGDTRKEWVGEGYSTHILVQDVRRKFWGEK